MVVLNKLLKEENVMWPFSFKCQETEYLRHMTNIRTGNWTGLILTKGKYLTLLRYLMVCPVTLDKCPELMFLLGHFSFVVICSINENPAFFPHQAAFLSWLQTEMCKGWGKDFCFLLPVWAMMHSFKSLNIYPSSFFLGLFNTRYGF